MHLELLFMRCGMTRFGTTGFGTKGTGWKAKVARFQPVGFMCLKTEPLGLSTLASAGVFGVRGRGMRLNPRSRLDVRFRLRLGLWLGMRLRLRTSLGLRVRLLPWDR